MIKADIIREIERATGVEGKAVRDVIEQFMSTVKDAVANGEAVYLRGFGTFSAKERAEKVARNILKKESIVVPAHKIPHFKPSDAWKEEML